MADNQSKKIDNARIKEWSNAGAMGLWIHSNKNTTNSNLITTFEGRIKSSHQRRCVDFFSREYCKRQFINQFKRQINLNEIKVK